MYLLVIDHPNSLEKIEREGQIVKIVGKGVMKSPGHPAGNQQYHRQVGFLTELTKKPNKVPLYNKDCDNHIEYLGKYRLLSWNIKVSWPGFRYFEYTLMRVERSTPGEEPVFPPESDPQ